MHRLFSVIVTILLTLVSTSGYGQDKKKIEPTWRAESTSLAFDSSGKVTISLIADIPEGYHVYSIDYECPNGGPLPAKVMFNADSSYSLDGDVMAIGDKEVYDDIFECNIKEFHGSAQLNQTIVKNAKDAAVSGKIEYQMCAPSGRCTLHTYSFEVNL